MFVHDCLCVQMWMLFSTFDSVYAFRTIQNNLRTPSKFPVQEDRSIDEVLRSIDDQSDDQHVSTTLAKHIC